MSNNSSQTSLIPPVPLPIEDSSPFDQNLITLTQREYIELKWQSTYWEAQHARAVAREEELKKELLQKEAIIRDLNQRLYGKKTEKGGSKSDVNPNQNETKPKRRKGHQKNSTTHGRTQL
jgi:hypothetical protein